MQCADPISMVDLQSLSTQSSYNVSYMLKPSAWRSPGVPPSVSPITAIQTARPRNGQWLFRAIASVIVFSLCGALTDCSLTTTGIQANTKHLYNICTTLAERFRRWSNIVQMLYNFFIFTGMDVNIYPRFTLNCLGPWELLLSPRAPLPYLSVYDRTSTLNNGLPSFSGILCEESWYRDVAASNAISCSRKISWHWCTCTRLRNIILCEIWNSWLRNCELLNHIYSTTTRFSDINKITRTRSIINMFWLFHFCYSKGCLWMRCHWDEPYA